MSRYFWNAKAKADDCNKLSISWLKRNGYFKPGCTKWGTVTWTWGHSEHKSSVGIVSSVIEGDERLNTNYTITRRETGEKESFNYKIPVTSTPCFFGGKRYWFICPWYRSGQYCGRRVGTLYLGGDVFACRHCYDLTYDSRVENHSFLNKNPIFKVMLWEKKASELRDTITVPYYKGKPTRKMRQLLRLNRRIYQYFPLNDSDDSW